MKRKIRKIKYVFVSLLLGILSLTSCMSSRGISGRMSANPYTLNQVIVTSERLSPDFIPVSIKDAPRHRTFGNDYWHKLNRGIKQALPDYSADKYMRSETKSVGNKEQTLSSSEKGK